MEQTFLYRQNEAQEGRLGVDAIIAKYPAFQFTVVVSTKRVDCMFFTFYFVLLSQGFGFQMFNEAKRILKLD